MTDIYFDNRKMTKKDMTGQIRDRMIFERQVAREETRNLTTTSTEETINFYPKKGE